MSAIERSGWRDKNLSARHRDWGHDCPMSDLDLIATEYDQREPIALIDYKMRRAPLEPVPSTIKLLSDANLYVMGRLGARAGLPAFVVFYGARFAWFQVQGLNRDGLKRVPGSQPLSERDYVSFLFELRGRELSEEVPLRAEIEIPDTVPVEQFADYLTENDGWLPEELRGEAKW